MSDTGSVEPSRSKGDSGYRWPALLVCVVSAALLIGFAALIRDGEADAREGLADRFDTRAALTASFAESFVKDVAERERSQAERLLAGRTVSQLEFERVVQSLGFEAAVLLDAEGRLLHVFPDRADLIGRDMTVEYPHLRAAVSGEIGVSEVVPSAARRIPVVAVRGAVRLTGGTARFLGGFTPAVTPLGAYLKSVVPVAGSGAVLVDRSGDPLASRHADPTSLGPALADLRPGITEVATERGDVTAAIADVPSTPWRVVLASPSDGCTRRSRRGSGRRGRSG